MKRKWITREELSKELEKQEEAPFIQVVEPIEFPAEYIATLEERLRNEGILKRSLPKITLDK